jgi:hypothetical protein
MTPAMPAWPGMERPDGVALRAVGFMAGDPAALDRFLAGSGLSAAELDQRPIPPRHLAAVLDFIIGDEAVLLAFSRRVELPPEAAYEARRRLTGGAWTQ